MRKLILGLFLLPTITIAHEVDCTDEHAYPIERYPEYLKCENREVIFVERGVYSSQGESSVLKVDCPPDYPLRGEDNKCYSCEDEKLFVEIFNKEFCDVCPNRQAKYFYYFNEKVLGCFKDCPNDKMFDGNRSCVACDYNDTHGIDEQECAKCPNRLFDGKYCQFKESPYKNKPLISLLDPKKNTCLDGDCWGTVDFFPCDVARKIYTTKKYCDVCPERVWQNGYCVLKNNLLALKAKKCPQGTIQSEEDDCFSCEDAVGGWVSNKYIFLKRSVPYFQKEECLKCPNLTYLMGGCLENKSTIELEKLREEECSYYLDDRCIIMEKKKDEENDIDTFNPHIIDA